MFAYLRVVLRRQKLRSVSQNLLRNGDLLIFRCTYESALFSESINFVRRERFRGILRFNRNPMIEPVRLVRGGGGGGKGMIRRVGNSYNTSHIRSFNVKVSAGVRA